MRQSASKPGRSPASAKRVALAALSVPLFAASRGRAQDSLGFSHQTYSEEHGRMQVQTETMRVQKTFTPWLDLTFREVYDGISGATPIGAPPISQLRMRDPVSGARIPPSSITGFTRQLNGISGASQGGSVPQAISQNTLPVTDSSDQRLASDAAIGLTWGPHRLVPEFSFSNEHDYRSYGLALNYTYEFNQKNTTLSLGWSHAYDQVLANQFTFLTHSTVKNTDSFLIGGTQLLSPGTVVGANVTIGYAHGYLNDPYLGVVFDESDLDPDNRVVLTPENRPSTRNSQALLLSLTQSLAQLDASIEGTYRFYHDSYGIYAHTVSLAWFQKIGRSIVISPSARYYFQTAADFYAIQFPGDPVNDPDRVPRFYSADYRLSELETLTLGLETDFQLREHLDLHLGYQCYWMRGLDRQTHQSVYPNANIFTVGVTYTF
jgi:Protein of unknown function (DUF3570)